MALYQHRRNSTAEAKSQEHGPRYVGVILRYYT